MESTVVDFFQFSENSDMTVGSTNKNPPYVSYIKINGKPILPPLINEEKRREIQKDKQKAIEMELKLAKQKKPAAEKINSISSDICSVVNVLPSHQTTPVRPVSLNLTEVGSGKAFALTKSWTEKMLNSYKNDDFTNYEFLSSQKNERTLDKPFRSTLEQQLASKDSIIIRNKLNKYQQSPIIEEQCLERYIDSDSDSKKDRKRWSPLKIDSLNSLKIELPSKDTEEKDENLETSIDESQNTPDTITPSPNLMRQNSYTLLTPSPALLNFIESQSKKENMQKSQSGRKTWDLTKAKKNWDSNNGTLRKSSDEDDEHENQFLNKSNCSLLDSLSGFNNSLAEYSKPNSMTYDSESTVSNSSRSLSKLGKVKCKIKGRKVKSSKNVPSPKTIENVPIKDIKVNRLQDVMGLGGKTDLTNLSNLLLKMKVDFERQKKELEEKQKLEMKKLEFLFQAKEVELLSKVNQLPKKCTKSIYSQSAREPPSQEPDVGMMGDGNHGLANAEKSNSALENCITVHFKRPHSAKDFHPQYYSQETECNRRTRSMDFSQGNQDTDLDVSFQDEFTQCKDSILNNENSEYIIDSDSMSNFSSHSSTVSSDNRHEPIMCNFKMFHKVSSEDYAKYNQAATVITAAARGFLTRRLLRTAHVQGLITTLKDAISCATELHTAPDIADSDIDLMRRLSRQIEAAWDEVYGVFFNTEISARLQLIAADRERLRAAIAKTTPTTAKNKSISSATRKSLDRKKGIMSKSHTSNGLNRVRLCTKMTASFPSPYFLQKQK